MASRTELYQITRELRRYLEWQMAGGAPGVLPASVAEREAWQELEKAGELARAQAMREALFGESPAKSEAKNVAKNVASSQVPSSQGAGRASGSRLDAVMGAEKTGESAAGSKTSSSSVPASSGGGLWNEIGSRPRPTFQAVEEPAAVAQSPGGQKPAGDQVDSQRVSENPKVSQQVGSVEARRVEPASGPKTVPESVPASSDLDDFGGYDESYIDYSEDYSEFEHVAAPVVEKVEKPAPRKVMTNAEKLAFLEKYLGDCRRCALHQGRTNVVFGSGNARARLMFVGESPGVEEDRRGVPFVGEAGELLDKMIGAMGLRREDVYVASVVKCRSSENRNPLAGEVSECSPFLLKQIEAVQPEVIVALGGLATQTLLGNATNLAQVRGRWHAWKDIAVMPTFNPNSLLKNERLKRDAWSDLQMVMARLAEKK